jgi:RNA polymerase sigma factor (sigma-70 family)
MEAKHIQVIAQFKVSLKEGLTVLYEAYGKHLYQFSMKNWSLDDDESYDILYKTLETVGKVIDRYEFTSEKHFTNWLFKIHKNNTLMAVRAKMAKEEIVYVTSDWQEEIEPEEYEGFSVNFDDHEIANIPSTQVYEEHNAGSPLFMALEKALQMIEETDRDILLLRMNNYTYEDIAVMLAIDNKQLKVKFSRAKAKVQKITMNLLKETSNEKK